ncbi:Nucleotide-binding universal stress protein, UspA family [Salinihabitans flavidus]|uniref:Nucleotide-binding universal stress protein, UspA family n=1 Tax=Salinihabitans flavidus TaxID=569882 RepID=A0A1H8LEP3_9RHOB|nr:universal stress protein [Salinihabitans flavidus]SEO03567.1 Nucleotide-binding universal stress protein, UspA family [Salinihabitans flavidus]
MYKNILVPIAPDHTRDTGKALNVARMLADEGATITALTVIEMIPGYIESQLPAGQLERNRDEMVAWLKAELGGVKDVKAAVVSGHSGRTILDWAAEKEVDCIVIASHDPGLSDYFLGSTAARVVRHAHCAVHVIR